MKICVYCASSLTLEDKYYQMGEDFGEQMAKRGHTLVYGGYDMGIMGAVARGVRRGGAEVIGVVPEIFNNPDFPYTLCTQVLHVNTMAERKQALREQADAFAVLAGGIGTYDEFFETLVLRSLGQLPKPIAVYNFEGCFDALDALLADSVKQNMMAEKTRSIPQFCKTAEAVLTALEQESIEGESKE